MPDDFAVFSNGDTNISQAAKLLGLTRDQLRYRMEKFQIS